MKTKPTLEEMAAAWRQCSARIDDLADRHHPQLQPPQTRPLYGGLRYAASVAMVAASVALAIACTPPPSGGRALHLTSHSHAVAVVEQMMEAAV